MAGTWAVPEQPRPGEHARHAWLVILTFVVAMAAAWALRSYVEARTVAFVTPDGSLAVTYPAGWTVGRLDKDALLLVSDGQAGASFRPQFTAQSGAAPKSGELRETTGLLSLRHSSQLREYRELSSRELTVAGLRAVEVTYAYVTDPPAGAGPVTLPIVVEARDVLLIKDGRLYTLTSASEVADATTYAPVFDSIVTSARLK